MIKYIKNLQNIQKKEIELYIENGLFIFSIMPLILNWVIGLYFLKDEGKKTYVYRSFLSSFLFLIVSSILYLMYDFIIDIYFNNFINMVFFILQLFVILVYIYIFIIQMLSYYKKQNFWILNKTDELYKLILEYL